MKAFGRYLRWHFTFGDKDVDEVKKLGECCATKWRNVGLDYLCDLDTAVPLQLTRFGSNLKICLIEKERDSSNMISERRKNSYKSC